MDMIKIENLQKKYPSPERGKEVMVLDGLNLTVKEGEFTAIMGESGAGKSTLMNIIGVLDAPDGGIYRLCGMELTGRSDRELSKIRSQSIGFIFQNCSLISSLTALENVKLPLFYQHLPKQKQIRIAQNALEQVGLSDRFSHLPGQLSGGQRQRVAIARAIATDPDVILADEPTGALDGRSGVEVMEALCRLHEQGKTILLITHDPKAAAYAQRILYLYDGKLHKTV